MSIVQAIIPTAGLSLRMNNDAPKPFLEILGKPIIVHTLESFEGCALIDSVILAVHKDCIRRFEEIVSEYSLNKVTQIVVGGKTRSESVSNALQKVQAGTEIVVVHDGARPVISSQELTNAIDSLKDDDALVMAVPVKSTIKTVDLNAMVVMETLDREKLWEIQTPQIFKKDVLIKAHASDDTLSATDDAALVEKIGKQVKIYEGNYQNLKVTTQEDLILAEAFLKQRG